MLQNQRHALAYALKPEIGPETELVLTVETVAVAPGADVNLYELVGHLLAMIPFRVLASGLQPVEEM